MPAFFHLLGILSGKSCLDYEAGIAASKFGNVSLMNYFFACFPFPCITMLTAGFADTYENGKEENWASSLTSPYISQVIEKTRKKRGFGVCLSSG